MIGKTVSHYKIIERIGAGGMGEVYLAEDTELRRRVALKFLPPGYSTAPDVLTRFKREARAAAALNHPNIITIHEVAMHGDRPYIVMAYVEGESLSEQIRSKSLSLPTVIDIAIQIGEGLSKAHQADVVHRDLKPDNIVIDEDGRAKILDFGLAKLRGATKLTDEASTLGTVFYMSPEQTRGEDVGPRSDLFSLGTVLYEMITGQLPFGGEHMAAVMYAITTEEPQPLRRFNNDVTPGLERIVFKMLAKDPGERYQTAADLVADLKHERKLSQLNASTARRRSGPRKRGPRTLKIAIPSSLLFIAILLVLILKPFRVEIAPDRQAEASENMLAVMYFENLADRGDEKRLGEIITSLLITDLSASDALRVVSSQRLYDILKGLDKEGTRNIDRNTATLVANRAGAQWMLLGNILQAEPTLVVTYQLVDVASGDVKDSQRVDGASGESIFSLVDRMTVELRNELSLTLATRGDIDRPVAEITTSSPDAYRHYLEGMEHLNKNYKEEAIESFRKAIEIDSTLAMAHLELAVPNLPLSFAEKQRHVKLARRYSTKVSERDRHFINSLYAIYFGRTSESIRELHAVIAKHPDDKRAYYGLSVIHWIVLSKRDQALTYARKAIELDPLYKLAYNRLAYIYIDLGEYEKALEAVDTYIALGPDEPNPYDTQAEVYGLLGRLDDAINGYKKAIEIKPDFGIAAVSLGNMYLFRQDYATAEAYYRQYLSHQTADLRAAARHALSRVPLHQGKFENTLAMLDRYIAADEADPYGGEYSGEFRADKYWSKALVYTQLGDYRKAIAAGQKALEIERTSGRGGSWRTLVELHARSKDFAAAETLLSSTTLDTTRWSGEDRAEFYYSHGIIEFEKGSYAAACDHFERAVFDDPEFYTQYALAVAYLKANRLTEAVRAFERILNEYSRQRADDPINSVLVYYYAGLAYQDSGMNVKAVAQFERFLDIWKDADPGIEEMADARRRLDSLKGGT
ncbi:MAG: protein kinase [Candidatus Krumholzibacteria bacterium]